MVDEDDEEIVGAELDELLTVLITVTKSVAVTTLGGADVEVATVVVESSPFPVKGSSVLPLVDTSLTDWEGCEASVEMEEDELAESRVSVARLDDEVDADALEVAFS